MGPPDISQRRSDYKRVPGDAAAQGTLLRIATCFGGRVEIVVSCMPLFDYGTTIGEWSYEGSGYDRLSVMSGDLAIEMESSLAIGILGARTYGRTTLEHGESAFVSMSWAGHGPSTIDEALAQLGPDRGLLARVDEHGGLPRPRVPPVHGAQRARAQGSQLRADRGDHGGRHHLAAGVPGRRAQLGLPLHLDPRHRVHAARAARARLRLGGVRVLRVHPRRGRRRPGEGRQARAADHVRDRRRDRPDREHARPPLRLRRRQAGAHRQRRVRPAAARRLGDAARLALRASAQRRADPGHGLGGNRRPRRHRDRAVARSRTRASGRCAATPSTSSRRR